MSTSNRHRGGSDSGSTHTRPQEGAGHARQTDRDAGVAASVGDAPDEDRNVLRMQAPEAWPEPPRHPDRPSQGE